MYLHHYATKRHHHPRHHHPTTIIHASFAVDLWFLPKFFIEQSDGQFCNQDLLAAVRLSIAAPCCPRCLVSHVSIEATAALTLAMKVPSSAHHAAIGAASSANASMREAVLAAMEQGQQQSCGRVSHQRERTEVGGGASKDVHAEVLTGGYQRH